MTRLTDKVAIVTGAAGSLGAAQVEVLSAHGASVIATDISDERGTQLTQQLRQAGHTVEYLHHDVTSESDWEALIARTIEVHGRVDVLVNNAGGNLPRSPLEERSLEDWERLMALNLRSVFLGTKHVIPAMRAAGGGSVVNISSLAALGLFSTMEACYAASKAGVTALTKAVASQYGSDGIRCNSVHPGAIETEMSKAYYNTVERRAARLAQVPLRKFGQPEDIAHAVLYLASDESAYTTGTEVVIDGGSLVH